VFAVTSNTVRMSIPAELNKSLVEIAIHNWPDAYS